MNTTSELFIRDLGGGLILRRGTLADADALADINSRMHSDNGPDQPEMGIDVWIRDLVAGTHPTTNAADFTVVEETATGRIVSTLCLISQTWTYAGIEFGAGRPELVCTLPDFRKRGLVRIQMDEVHKWSSERGHLMQFITGIPNFYRQFGYDMALDFVGRRTGYEGNLPKLKDGESEPVNIRPAREDDMEFVLGLYEAWEKRYLISCKRSLDVVQYESFGKRDGNINRFEKMIIEDTNGNRIGFFEHPSGLWMDGLTCVYFALVGGVSFLEVSPSVARYLWKKGGEYAERDKQTRATFSFMLGENHPVYEAMDDRLPAQRKPYAFYTRVPDLPAFLRRIQPVLEERLAQSIAAGHSGELRLNFYTSGVRLVFERGRIISIEPMKVGSGIETDASFPDLTFHHLLFGHRSFDELRHAFIDCFADNNTARVLVNALFPKKLSDVYPLA